MVEKLVLLSMLIAGEEAYGVSVQRILERDVGRSVTLGAIYTALDRLLQKGLVTSELGDPKPVKCGRRTRQYKPTPVGLARLWEVRRIREAMWDKIHPDIIGEVR